MQVRTPITVRYGETDMMGVVYHANYLLYFEDARVDYVEAVAMPYSEIEEAGYMCPIYAVDMAYGTPLRYGEKAFVVTTVSHMRPTRIVYHQRVFREDMDPEVDKPLVDAYITACMVERENFRPVSFKRELPELYAKYQEAMEPEDRDVR